MHDFTVPSAAVPFALCGIVSVVAGGVVAAVTGPTDWTHGSWMAAFLVLVMGVGQVGLGLGQAIVVDPSRRIRSIEVATYNVGSALVLAGTLIALPVVVTVGGVGLVVALGTFLTTGRRGGRGSWVGRIQTALLVVILVSVPIGIALSWTRS